MFNVKSRFYSETAATAAQQHSMDLAVNQTRDFPEYYGRAHHRKGKPRRLIRTTEMKSTQDDSVSELEVFNFCVVMQERSISKQEFRFTRLHNCLDRLTDATKD